MDDTARTEYPAMLESLQPGQAARTLNDRVKRINKINLEIADWLQERRRIEEQYVLGLRRLAQSSKGPNSQSELGVFRPSWARIINAVEDIAQSHHAFADKLEEDLEKPLRAYQQRQDYVNMHDMSSNLTALAKKLEKPNKKDNKTANSQEWQSSAPYIFEKLQEVDESRINHLRDVLTQYQTHEADKGERVQGIAGQTLAIVVEVKTEDEIRDFASSSVAGLPPAPTRNSTRRSSVGGRQPSFEQGPPPLPGTDTMNSTASTYDPPPTRGSQSQRSHHEDDFNEQLPSDQPKESKLRRLGTLFGRRRQSVHGGFGSLSPGKSAGPTFGRLGSSHGRGLSPRTSSTNLHDSGRLASLAETPDTPTRSHIDSANDETRPHEGTNGVHGRESAHAQGVNGTSSADVFDVPPPPGPPPAHQNEKGGELAKDSEGFTVRAPMNDPISEAQREAAGEEADQLFKLNIQNKPVDEEDPEAKKAALSSVANTLKIGPATRRSSTIRGRRDVRNTVYVPPPGSSAGQHEFPLPAITGSPPLPSGSSFPRSPALNALASETSVAGTSDSQSVRSGHSLGSLAHAKHPDLTGPGLQSSIIETVSAIFEDGAIKSVNIAGELAFVNNDQDASSEKTHETIRINNFPKLERIGPNRIFVQNASLDQPDQFALDLSHLSKTSIAFSYKVFTEESDAAQLGQHAPIFFKPAWKPQDDKLGLLIQYQLNHTSSFTAPVTLHNVVLVATYEGRATGAQTKPSGTHLKDKHLVYWRLGDVTLTNEPQKVICRVIGAEGVCPVAGHVEARWEYAASADEAVGSGISISRLSDKAKGKDFSDDDPFADTGSPAGQTWADVPAVRKLVSGKYESK
ncbi:Suppressor of Profilin deletion [Conoideocrella luteorostrata]|uniref:Suppressor of Profilin deletion n=1 Tax=Conoideocrella luteorostrata TaxID=1105319 RepID=A0AAJ0FYR4_9HYPO|nr:Suppressor of Profilin deletion [Conoideocrella luteorostrata]